MKILIATPDYHQQRGNTVTANRISSELKKRGAVVSIISTTGGTVPAENRNFDVIHGFHAYKFYQYRKKYMPSECSFVITMTGTDLNSDLFNQERRQDVLDCLEEAEAIHLFSEDARIKLLNELPSVASRTFVIPQGSSIFLLKDHPVEKNDGAFLFLLPAGIRKVKNVPFAIHALKELRKEHPSIRLLIVGPVIEEDEASIVRSLVKENSDWAEYAGHLPHEMMGGLYAKAGALLNTSFHEGQSTAILEALGSGVPVLVSGNEGNSSIVQHMKTGLIYTTKAEFLDYAARLIGSPSLRSSLAAAARAWSAGRHQGMSEGKAILEMYKYTLRKKGAGNMPKTP